MCVFGMCIELKIGKIKNGSWDEKKIYIIYKNL